MRRHAEQLDFDCVRHGGRRPRRRSQAVAESADPTSIARAIRAPAARARDAQGSARRSVAANGEAGARDGALVRAGVRARRLPTRPLLAPGEPRAPDRRGRGPRCSGKRHEGTRFAARQGREPHLRALRSRSCRSLPRAPAAHAARNATAYVLLNARKHAARAGRTLSRAVRIDPASSGRWFDGWRESATAPPGRRPVARPRGWLLAVGWKRWHALE